jgi:hypothetical protein
VQRRVHTYRNYIDIDRLQQRIVQLNAEHKMDAEIAAILNQEGFVAARERLAVADPLARSHSQDQRRGQESDALARR